MIDEIVFTPPTGEDTETFCHMCLHRLKNENAKLRHQLEHVSPCFTLGHQWMIDKNSRQINTIEKHLLYLKHKDSSPKVMGHE